MGPLQAIFLQKATKPEPGSDQAILLIIQYLGLNNRCFPGLEGPFQGQNGAFKKMLPKVTLQT
jgi:hypothetical protein